MTKINQAELERIITNGEKHSYRSLREHFLADQTQAMQIDRTLQKLRRNGIIAFKRTGHIVLWQVIPTAAATPAAA